MCLQHQYLPVKAGVLSHCFCSWFRSVDPYTYLRRSMGPCEGGSLLCMGSVFGSFYSRTDQPAQDVTHHYVHYFLQNDLVDTDRLPVMVFRQVGRFTC